MQDEIPVLHLPPAATRFSTVTETPKQAKIETFPSRNCPFLSKNVVFGVSATVENRVPTLGLDFYTWGGWGLALILTP